MWPSGFPAFLDDAVPPVLVLRLEDVEQVPEPDAVALLAAEDAVQVEPDAVVPHVVAVEDVAAVVAPDVEPVVVLAVAVFPLDAAGIHAEAEVLLVAAPADAARTFAEVAVAPAVACYAQVGLVRHVIAALAHVAFAAVAALHCAAVRHAVEQSTPAVLDA